MRFTKRVSMYGGAIEVTRLTQLGWVVATSLILLIAIGGIYGISGFTDIEPGEVGLKIKKLGTNKGMQSDVLDTGLHWIEPVTMDVATYDTRLRQYSIKDLPAQTKDGQKILVDISLEVGLVDNQVPHLHEKIGKNYFDQVVYPATRAAVRNSTATQLSDEIYTGTGRTIVQKEIESVLMQKGQEYGIRIMVNLRDILFTNDRFVETLEQKAMAAQEVIIKERQAEAAANEAIRVANIAEGQKQKAIKEAEAESERLRLQGLGERQQKVEIARGNLALFKAEAEGLRLKNAAFGAENIVSMEWAKYLGPNVKVYGVPTGAPNTANVMDLSGILGGVFKGAGK